MKTLGLIISLEGLKLDDEAKKLSVQEIVSNFLKSLMLGWGSQQQKGMNEEDRRKYYKICDILEKAVKDKAETIELEDDYMGYLRKCKREIGFNPNDGLRRIEELIEAVKDR